MSESEWVDDPAPNDGDWVDDSEGPGALERYARGTLNALPAAGAMFGGAAGTMLGIPSGPGAIATGLAGAGLGAAGGEALKNIGEHFLGDEQSRKEIYGGPAKAALDGVTYEMGGQVLSKGVGMAADAAAPYVQKTGEGARNLAKKFGARALGAERGTIKKLGADKVDELGAYALDEGLLSPLASTDDLITRNAANQAKGGAMMDEVYTTIDDAGKSTFNPQKAAEQVNEEVGSFWRSPINRGETNQLENTLESILMRGEGNIPIKEAQALKQELGKVANWKNNLSITDKERMARDAYGIVSSQIDEAVELGAKEIGSEGLLNTLKEGKRLYGNSKGAQVLLENKNAAEVGNKMFGLTDTIAGTGAMGAMGPAGLGVLAAKKGVERYGYQNAALGLNKIGKTLMKSPRMLEAFEKNPQVFQSLVQKLESQAAPQMSLPRAADKDQGNGAMNFKDSMGKDAILQKTQGSKYGQVLQNAAKNGAQSLSAAHYVLSSRDPSYRKLLEDGDQ
jgi:hypothetical protein